MKMLMKLEIEQETVTVMAKIEGGKTYFNHGSVLNNKKELLEAACDKFSSFMYEEAKKIMSAF